MKGGDPVKYLVLTAVILGAGFAQACPMSKQQQAQTPVIVAPTVGS